MSINTINAANDPDFSNPNAYLDAKSSAIVSLAGQEGIAGWVFDIPSGESVDSEWDVTDHYTESGSFITDHMIKKPEMITLSGFIGELVFSAPKKGSAQAVFASLTNSLGAVSGYLGPLTPQAEQRLAVVASIAASAASQLTAIQKQVSNLKRFFSGADAVPSLQSRAYQEIKAMADKKEIVTVQTPWGFFKNMVIKSISAKQDDKTNDYTDFSITLKEMRFTDIKKTSFDSGAYQSSFDLQNSQPNTQGLLNGQEPSRNSLAFDGGRAMFGTSAMGGLFK